MQDLYELLQNPSKENLRLHSISIFNYLIDKYPSTYEAVISYINECFNYHSTYLVDEKDWGQFLLERFVDNNLPEEMREPLMNYECPVITQAIAEFLGYQKQSVWNTYVAKQNLRIASLATMQSHSAVMKDKKDANELVTTLDLEINELLEKLKQDQKRFGNYRGYNDVKAAKVRHSINIAHFIDLL